MSSSMGAFWVYLILFIILALSSTVCLSIEFLLITMQWRWVNANRFVDAQHYFPFYALPWNLSKIDFQRIKLFFRLAQVLKNLNPSLYYLFFEKSELRWEWLHLTSLWRCKVSAKSDFHCNSKVSKVEKNCEFLWLLHCKLLTIWFLPFSVLSIQW